MAVIPWTINVTIDNATFSTTHEPDRSVAAVVGPLTIAVDNGTDIGDMRTESCTLTIRDFRFSPKSYLKYDTPFFVTIKIGDEPAWRIYDGRIQEADISIIKHPKYGTGIEATITGMDDSASLLETIPYSSELDGIVKLDLLNLTHASSTLSTKLNAIGLYFGRTSPESVLKHISLPDGAPRPNERDPLLVNLEGYGWKRDSTLREHLQNYALVTGARLFAEQGLVGIHIAKHSHDNVWDIPARFIDAPSSVKTSAAHRLDEMSIKLSHTPDNYNTNYSVSGTRTSRWFYPNVVRGKVAKEYDFSQFALSMNIKDGNHSYYYYHGLCRSLLERPKSDYQLGETRVYVSQLAAAAPHHTSSFLREVFQVSQRLIDNPGSTFIPTVIVTGISPEAGLPMPVNGVVDQAVLTINPLARSARDRATLDLTLGPGDHKRGTTAPTRRYPKWSEMNQPWRDAPTVPAFDS